MVSAVYGYVQAILNTPVYESSVSLSLYLRSQESARLAREFCSVDYSLGHWTPFRWWWGMRLGTKKDPLRDPVSHGPSWVIGTMRLLTRTRVKISEQA